MTSPVTGLLLAAGAGRRMGGPKALLRDAAGVPFLDRTVGALLDGGCAGVTVVLGAAAEEASALLAEAGWRDDPAVSVVEASDWATGMGASLRAGLASLVDSDARAALVTLVDLPDVDASVMHRLLAWVGADETTLARSTYSGVAGHPVLLGRAHWEGVMTAAQGDRGARDYLATREVIGVECGDLASGEDVDHP